jgi:transcriptional regulator with XRE-family HTH domain
VSDASQFIAGRLRVLRSQAALSQEQAADLVGITFKYYQRLESGTVVGIRLSSIEKITKAYGIDLETFFSKRKPKVRKFKVLPPPHRKRKSPMRAAP